MEAQELLFALLRIAVCAEPVSDAVKALCTPELLEKVYHLALRHDLAHLIGQAASKLQLPESDALTKCKKAAMQAFGRYMQQSYAYEQACAALEGAKIPFIPLKGSVLRSYYPEAWMRTSCDIDILVKEADLNAAVKVLTEELSYVAGGRGDHDVGLQTPNGMYLELHYDTIQERYDVNGCRQVLAEIWDDAKPKQPGSCHFVLSDEMFYFYHIAHMAKHFGNGGCGIRTFLDVWVLNHKISFDRQKRDDLLQAGGLLKFARAARQLAEHWFSGAAPEDMTQAMSDYIIRAGTYGSRDNRAAVGQARMGKTKYLLLRRVFMPYDYLKAEYPVLKEHKWLTPAYQVVRWSRMIAKGGLGRTVGELKAHATMDQGSVSEASDLIKYLGL